MPVARIDDPADLRLAELTGLTDAEARAHLEGDVGCFVAEGLLALQTVVATGHRIRSVLVSEPKLDRVLGVLGDIDARVFVAPRAVVEATVGFAMHRGVVASVDRPPLANPAALLAAARRVLILEGINDHENLGAIFRNAAAFGADAVVLDPTCADPLYRRSVRVSLGHVLRVPWTRLPALPEGLASVREAGLATVALTPSGDERLADVAPGDRLAWLLGAEGPGLTPATLAAAGRRVRIPIADGVDSLNVATAAAVALAATSTLE